MRPTKLLAVGVLLIGGLFLWSFWHQGAFACSYTPTTDPVAAVKATPWIADIRIQACGGAISDGGFEILARNQRTGEKKIVASSPEVIQSIAISGGVPNTLIITLPNRVALSDSIQKFSNVRVVYKFLPHDDPHEREMYRRWTLNPNDPKGRNWFCTTQWPKMDANTRELNNSSYRAEYMNSRHSLC